MTKDFQIIAKVAIFRTNLVTLVVVIIIITVIGIQRMPQQIFIEVKSFKT